MLYPGTALRLMLAASLIVSLTAHGASAAQGDGAAAQQRGSAAAEKDLDRHLSFLARRDSLIKTGGTELIFVGDSITDGWRQNPQHELFDDYFGRYRPYNIGVSGDETQHVLWRIDHGELDGLAPKLVVLMIGTNNLANANKMGPDETADGVAAVVQAIRRKLPGSKILLLGIFPRGNRKDDPLRVAVDAANTRIAGLADRKTVFYRDIAASFLAPDGTLSGEVMPDYLHPNARGYRIWADTIRPDIDRLVRGAR
ncbi:GDSL-type esterase/lipase family protein [Sphingomonas sp. PB4P5]|uniref:GDSL-type esterase/lipase family protein n=1 Tax=Parasphingomonas puruogangriensis TaxID=3096155 RepID=UPI002FC5AFA1